MEGNKNLHTCKKDIINQKKEKGRKRMNDKKMCKQCDNYVCKGYKGTCRKYRFHDFLDRGIKWIKKLLMHHRNRNGR